MTSFIGIGDLAEFMAVAVASLNTSLANLAVEAAQQKVRDYLAQQITLAVDDTAVLDGSGRRKLRLPERPVRSVTSVTVRGNTDPEDEDTYIRRRSFLIRVDGTDWPAGVANITAVYTHGWDTAELDSDTSDSDFDVNHVPAIISLVALTLARRMYDAVLEDTPITNRSSETIGSYSYTVNDQIIIKFGGVELIDAEKNALAPYRIEGAG